MKVEYTVNQERHEATLDVWVEKERLEQAKRRAARKISKDVSIPGFRRGKAPYEIVVRFIGEEAIVHQALDEIADEVYSEAMKQAGLEAEDVATLEKYELTPQGELHLTFSVPLLAEVVLPEDYRQLRIPLTEVEEEKEVEKEIEHAQFHFATFEQVDREAQWGDSVDADVSLKGESETLRIYLDPLQKDTQADMQFLHSFIGRKSGEEYEFQNQEGKSLKVKILSVYSTTLPTREELAKILGFSSEEELRQAVRESLQMEARLEHGEEVLEALRTRTRFAYPQSLMERFAARILENKKEEVSEFGLTWEGFLQQAGMTEEEYLERQVIPSLRRSIEQMLLRREIIQREKIGAYLTELEEKIEEVLRDYEEMEDPVRFKKLLKEQEFAENVFRQAVSRLVREKVRLFLSDLASGALERMEQEAAAQASEPQQSEQSGEEQVPAVVQADEAAQDQLSTES
jgi:trigger factor